MLRMWARQPANMREARRPAAGGHSDHVRKAGNVCTDSCGPHLPCLVRSFSPSIPPPTLHLSALRNHQSVWDVSHSRTEEGLPEDFFLMSALCAQQSPPPLPTPLYWQQCGKGGPCQFMWGQRKKVFTWNSTNRGNMDPRLSRASGLISALVDRCVLKHSTKTKDS